MRTDTTSAASAIFAANRARGSVTFDVHQVEGVTRRRRRHRQMRSLAGRDVDVEAVAAGDAARGIDENRRETFRLR